MEVFIQNNVLRNAIKNGIDVVYVNDGIYAKTDRLTIYPSEYLLGTLLTLVRPRIIQGLSGGKNLPRYICNLCHL